MSGGSPVERLALLPPVHRMIALRGLTAEQRIELTERWPAWAHDGQV